jgi:hypothetical protein
MVWCPTVRGTHPDTRRLHVKADVADWTALRRHCKRRLEHVRHRLPQLTKPERMQAIDSDSALGFALTLSTPTRTSEVIASGKLNNTDEGEQSHPQMTMGRRSSCDSVELDSVRSVADVASEVRSPACRIGS